MAPSSLLVALLGLVAVSTAMAASATVVTASISSAVSSSPCLRRRAAFCSPIGRLRRSTAAAVSAISSTAIPVPSGSATARLASAKPGPEPAIRHYLQFSDFSPHEYCQILTRAAQLKADDAARRPPPRPDVSPQIVLIFDKPSTRTYASFTAAAHKLGADCIDLSGKSQLGRGESIADTVRALGRYADAWVVRTFRQSDLEEMARHSRSPVVNALTDQHHPCQIVADVLTFLEHRGAIAGKVVAWVGDGNNMANSWLQAAATFGFRLRVATPKGYEIAAEILAEAPADCYEIVTTKEEAVHGADLVTTDVWTSMGFEDGEAERRAAFDGFQVDAALMRLAKADALFMHCLPVHRGEEVAAEVVDGAQSVIWDEAENRLYVQMAILEFLLRAANRIEAAVV